MAAPQREFKGVVVPADAAACLWAATPSEFSIETEGYFLHQTDTHIFSMFVDANARGAVLKENVRLRGVSAACPVPGGDALIMGETRDGKPVDLTISEIAKLLMTFDEFSVAELGQLKYDCLFCPFHMIGTDSDETLEEMQKHVRAKHAECYSPVPLSTFFDTSDREKTSCKNCDFWVMPPISFDAGPTDSQYAAMINYFKAMTAHARQHS